ncbi:hypothetical protein BCR33DRAFT_711432 [Rhizoclosmatium globosum]|uniref:Uncharacterized protein n=1 Tax=Rhizoclosmatium globosum TaxID=329046 RepID=A0A1Y2D174_9FUNG|nr:hypothetical protein BCR33DRAFT_711432 [Rhizoclosmatium globosum]|eukprot:ORY53043.1 hypothetical protein BCR33DRAFT_711432 [Rhizoclosmatium globosum]
MDSFLENIGKSKLRVSFRLAAELAGDYFYLEQTTVAVSHIESPDKIRPELSLIDEVEVAVVVDHSGEAFVEVLSKVDENNVTSVPTILVAFDASPEVGKQSEPEVKQRIGPIIEENSTAIPIIAVETLTVITSVAPVVIKSMSVKVAQATQTSNSLEMMLLNNGDRQGFNKAEQEQIIQTETPNSKSSHPNLSDQIQAQSLKHCQQSIFSLVNLTTVTTLQNPSQRVLNTLSYCKSNSNNKTALLQINSQSYFYNLYTRKESRLLEKVTLKDCTFLIPLTYRLRCSKQLPKPPYLPEKTIRNF